jgi:hypothetical protein
MFKTSITVEIRLLHLQPFTKSHFHSLVIVLTATAPQLLQQPKQIACYDV